MHWVAARAGGLPIVPAIETARGVLAAQEIAFVKGVAHLSIGGLDLLRDLYGTLGEGDPDKGWTIRLYWNPLAPWIWLGAGLCALGGFISLSDRRLRIGAPRRSRASVQAAE